MRNKFSVRTPKPDYKQTASLKFTNLLICLILLVFGPYMVTATTSYSSDGHETTSSSSSNAKTKEISEMNILLPVSQCPQGIAQQDCRTVKHKVSASNGCYQWEISHPQMVRLTALEKNADGDCVSVVQIQPMIQKESKTLIWITAKDKNSGSILRAQVKLGIIDRLAIQSKYRQIYVNDKKHLRVVAFDDDGNIFSGLEGLRFDWNIVKGEKFVKKILRPPGYRQLDSEGSDIFYVLGLIEGGSDLQVSIIEPGYNERIKHDAIHLRVVDPFIIEPENPVYILPTSEFKYDLSKLKIGNDWYEIAKNKITLPSAKYQWTLEKGAEGEIDQTGTFVSHLKSGSFDILVEDTFMRNNTAEAMINVVYPHKVEARILDITELQDELSKIPKDAHSFAQTLLKLKEAPPIASSHILVEERLYMIYLEVYDKDENLITLTDNLLFESLDLLDQTNAIKIDRRNKIKSEITFWTKKIDTANKRFLTSHKLAQINPAKSLVQTKMKYTDYSIDKLTDELELIVTKPVQINHPVDHILLPVYYSNDGRVTLSEQWFLTAEGGSGIYEWSIADSTVASVEGSAMIRSKQIGQTTLTLRDHRNNQNIARINIIVEPIYQLDWLENQMELSASNTTGELGESTIATVMALDKHGRKFTNCSSAPLSYHTKSDGIIWVQSLTKSWTQIGQYVSSNKDLLKLRQRFDEEPTKKTISDLSQPSQDGQPKTPWVQTSYNNFGICGQAEIIAGVEGRAFVNVATPLQRLQLESEFSEIAVYKPLKTVGPVPYFEDLLSINQLGQQHQSLDHLFSLNLKKFSIQRGAEFTWTVNGGTNFWQDYSDSYFIQTEVEPKTIQSVKVAKQNISSTHFSYSISCFSQDMAASDHVNVTMRQQSKLTNNLLKPASHYVRISVICGAPAQARLLWAQPSTTQLKEVFLPRSRNIQSERTHWVLAGSEHYVKYFLSDLEDKVFTNFSSINAAITPSNPTLASVQTELQNGQMENNRFEYSKAKVIFADQVGLVYLNLVTESYVGPQQAANAANENKGGSSFWGGGSSVPATKSNSAYNIPDNLKLKDSMRVEVVKPVAIEPHFKSLYIGRQDLNQKQAFKFEISHGSGQFIVSTNDTSIVEIQQHDREVFIYPRSPGTVELTIEDFKLPDAPLAKAVILVSDISKLILKTPRSLIEQGDQMNVHLIAYDSQGIEFDADQYPLMTFAIETEMTGVRRQNGLRIEANKTSTTDFKAYGVIPGIYQQTAFTHKYNHHEWFEKGQAEDPTISKLIVSEMVRVEVFPMLEIKPGDLLLTPNMRYTLQILGGPQQSSQNSLPGSGSLDSSSSVEIRFAIDDESIATVDQFREVTAHRVGDTMLKYQIVQLKHLTGGSNDDEGRDTSAVVSKKQIPIRVRLVTDVEIPLNHQRQVYSDSLIKLDAILKYNNEYFSQGLAPVSYSWNCSQTRVINLEIPNHLDMAKGRSNNIGSTSSFSAGSGSQLLMQSKNIKDNTQEFSQMQSNFFTNFNSSSVYAKAGRDGEALVNTMIAIEYPEEYQKEQNWFQARALIKVASQLRIYVPDLSSNTGSRQIQDDQYSAGENTHHYLLPPNSLGHIRANLETKLRLGYSVVSSYDRITDSKGNQQTVEDTQPIVSLVDDRAIRTFDKYGKVTVIVEEGAAFSDQVAMLNVFIADIYSVQVINAYDALQMPLGSELKLPMHFQNEHGKRFAQDIEGIKVGFEVSHPRVVGVSLDKYNQTLQLQSLGSGDCNIKVYLEEYPNIFDVIRVRVSSMVMPLSPVYLHVGGQVKFRVTDQDSLDNQDLKPSWKSTSPSVLGIDTLTGHAQGYNEGRAEVLMQNHANAASIVHVAKVKYGQVAQSPTPQILSINTDETQNLRVRIQLFLEGSFGEELSPTVQYEGVPLIEQNVGIMCETDFPDFVKAEGVVSEVEGYFCKLRYVYTGAVRSMPRFIKVTATVSAKDPRNPSKNLYQVQAAQFDVQLLSKIQVEKEFAQRGIQLYKNKRQEVLHVFSSSDFDIKLQFDNSDLLDNPHHELVKYQVSRADTNSNDYKLTVIIPSEVRESFTAKLILENRITKFQRALPVQFQNQVTSGSSNSDSQSQQENQNNLGNPSRKNGSQTRQTTKNQKTGGPVYEGESVRRNEGGFNDIDQGTSWSSYFIMLFLILLSVCYLSNQFFNVNLIKLALDKATGHSANNNRAHTDMNNQNGRVQNVNIREPRSDMQQKGQQNMNNVQSKQNGRAMYYNAHDQSLESRGGMYQPHQAQQYMNNYDNSQSVNNSVGHMNLSRNRQLPQMQGGNNGAGMHMNQVGRNAPNVNESGFSQYGRGGANASGYSNNDRNRQPTNQVFNNDLDRYGR